MAIDTSPTATHPCTRLYGPRILGKIALLLLFAKKPQPDLRVVMNVEKTTVGSRFTTGLRSRIFGCKSNRRKASTI
jgi:hypothetical protein